MKRKKVYYLVASFIFFIGLGLKSNAQEPIWAEVVTGYSNQYGIDADFDSNGNLYVIGYGIAPNMTIDNINYATNGDGDAFIAKFSSNRVLLWFKTLGGDDNVYFDEGLDIHVDINDDVIVLVKSAGDNFTYNGDTLAGVNSPGQNSGEGVIIKIDNNGNYLWHDHGSISSSFQNVTTDSGGNIYLTGWFREFMMLGDSIELINPTNGTTTDMFVAKYKDNGDLLWAKHAGGVVHNAFAHGHNIAIDELSNKIVVLGRFSKDITFETGVLPNATSSSTFIATYDQNGTELWKMAAFNGDFSYCQGLDISPNGLIGIAGFNSLGSSSVSGLVGFYNLSGAVQSEEVYSSSFCRLNSLEFNQSNECFITGRFKDSVSLGPSFNQLTLSAVHSNFLLKLDTFLLPDWTNLMPISLDSKITCESNRVIYSASFSEPFVYNYGSETIMNSDVEALFAEISNPPCPVSLGTDVQAACNTFTWIDGITYSQSTDSPIFKFVNGAENGCDSIVNLDLTITYSATLSDTRTACDSYTWIDGITYESSNNTATFVVSNGAENGCDSIVNLDLTINQVSDLTITIDGNIATSNNNNASYQWLDCDRDYAIVSGETGVSFSAASNGNYSVELTENGCLDTTACVNISKVGILESDFDNELLIYPNPTNGNFSIDLGEIYNSILITILDSNGRLVQSKKYEKGQVLDLKLIGPKATYLLGIKTKNRNALIHLVKE